MPVMIPGKAIGKISNIETKSRPKNFVRASAAAAKGPSTIAITVDQHATCADNRMARHTSSRSRAMANHFVVSPGGGKT